MARPCSRTWPPPELRAQAAASQGRVHASPLHGHPSARAGRSEGRGLGCSDRRRENQLHWGDEESGPRSLPSPIRSPSLTHQVPFRHGLGVARPLSDPGRRTLAWPLVPVGSLQGRPRRRGSEMLGGPGTPQESQLHTRDAPSPGCPGWARQARRWGAEPPPGYSLAPGPAVAWRPPPQAALPSGEAGGTNQPPGAVRPGGWALIDTRWPLPRGRLGGGSAGWEAKP